MRLTRNMGDGLECGDGVERRVGNAPRRLSPSDACDSPSHDRSSRSVRTGEPAVQSAYRSAIASWSCATVAALSSSIPPSISPFARQRLP